MQQYSQRPAARCQTCRTSAASMRASGSGAFLGFDLQGAASLGFEDGEKRAGLGVGEQFILLAGGKRVLLVAHGQVVHTGLVLVAETEVEDVAGHGEG